MDQRPGEILGREDRVELDGPTAKERRLLDERDADALASEIERGPQTRHSAADDQGAMDGRHPDHLERLQEPCLGDGGANERNRLLGRGFGTVRVGPARLLADVCR